MSLIPTQFGDNPFQPGVFAETYQPDQLIAGKEHIITENDTLAQQLSVLPRGTLLGKVTATGNVTVCKAPGVAATLTVTTSPTGALTNGVYPGIPLNTTTGAGAGAVANLTVAGGVVSAAAIVAGEGGGGYAVGNTLSIPAGTIPGQTGNGVFTVATLAAADGSAVPYGVLVDTTDATGGTVNCGVYLKGEFNANRMNIDASWGNSVANQAAALNGQCRAATLYLKIPVDSLDPNETNASGV
jgi:hypothetical protein